MSFGEALHAMQMLKFTAQTANFGRAQHRKEKARRASCQMAEGAVPLTPSERAAQRPAPLSFQRPGGCSQLRGLWARRDVGRRWWKHWTKRDQAKVMVDMGVAGRRVKACHKACQQQRPITWAFESTKGFLRRTEHDRDDRTRARDRRPLHWHKAHGCEAEVLRSSAQGGVKANSCISLIQSEFPFPRSVPVQAGFSQQSRHIVKKRYLSSLAGRKLLDSVLTLRVWLWNT
ncbi:hypothetical protein BJY52DRAFT_1374741 [Lactarius psammicola]|nr:hypothetical protein BJY52DRAFT_1374741 [Lactarius psammicola]